MVGNRECRGCLPEAPPFPGLIAGKRQEGCGGGCGYGSRGGMGDERLRWVEMESVRDLWDRLFKEGYRADVSIQTNDGVIPAHASILGMASPVMNNMLKKSKSQGGRRKAMSFRGVPHQAVRAFIRFLYSSCYQQEEMNQYALHLLVLSHVFVIPSLKQLCVQQLEKGMLNKENVVDVFQLARLCDAPRLCLICHRFILKNFKVVSESEGWKVMKQSNPKLEKRLLKSIIEDDLRKQEREKKMEEREIYLQLLEAMEALVHICRDGCRMIGPHDRVLKANGVPCQFPACKGIESLVRHFAGCKARIPGGCTHCKRMWQLLELHSRLCSETDVCKVPLCRHFKEKMQHQSKKDEMKWKLLVSKVKDTKKLSGAPLLASMAAVCA